MDVFYWKNIYFGNAQPLPGTFPGVKALDAVNLKSFEMAEDSRFSG